MVTCSDPLNAKKNKPSTVKMEKQEDVSSESRCTKGNIEKFKMIKLEIRIDDPHL